MVYVTGHAQIGDVIAYSKYSMYTVYVKFNDSKYWKEKGTLHKGLL